MKLAEALIQRADTQRRLAQLESRMMRSAKVQEDEQPPEDPADLFAELDQLINQLTRLIQQINKTNSNVQFDETRTLTDALAERDTLMMKRSIINSVMQTAQPQARYGRMEIKELPTINIAETQKQVDDISRQYRELDTAIQQLNWVVDLIED